MAEALAAPEAGGMLVLAVPSSTEAGPADLGAGTEPVPVSCDLVANFAAKERGKLTSGGRERRRTPLGESNEVGFFGPECFRPHDPFGLNRCGKEETKLFHLLFFAW